MKKIIVISILVLAAAIVIYMLVDLQRTVMTLQSSLSTVEQPAPLVERSAPPQVMPNVPVQAPQQQSIQQRLDDKLFYSCDEEIKHYRLVVEKDPSEYNQFKLEQVIKRCQSVQDRQMKK